MKYILLAVFFLFLSGCASDQVWIWKSKPMMAPSGSMGVYIYCLKHHYCFRGAQKSCPDGYEIIDKLQTIDRFNDRGRRWNQFTYRMFIECK